MESSIRRCMLIFIRHGERLDQVPKLPSHPKIDFKFDPPLTEQGM